MVQHEDADVDRRAAAGFLASAGDILVGAAVRMAAHARALVEERAVRGSWLWLTAPLRLGGSTRSRSGSGTRRLCLMRRVNNDLDPHGAASELLLSALLFWWALFYAHGRRAYGSGVLYIFTTAIHTGILGALLTFAPRLWYPAYSKTTQAWGLTPLQDQQIGGLIMWVPASLVYIVARVVAFAGMDEGERRSAGKGGDTGVCWESIRAK